MAGSPRLRPPRPRRLRGLGLGHVPPVRPVPRARDPDPSASPVEFLGKFYGQFGGMWFVSFVLWSIQLGAVSFGAAQRLRGGKAGLGRMLAVGLQRSFAMFGLVVISMFALAATACTIVGPLLLACGWAASAPAVAVEGAGPIRALGRSWGLTQGHRWKILAAIVLVYLAMLFAFWVVQSALTGGISAWPGAATATTADGLRALALPMAIFQLVGGILGTVLPVTCAVVHHGLCLVKEGGDPVHLAQVFE